MNVSHPHFCCRAFFFGLVCFYGCGSFAADIETVDWDGTHLVIRLEGVIELGDYGRIVAKAQKLNADRDGIIAFQLNTPGGNVGEAIKIGRFVHGAMIPVFVEGASFREDESNPVECYSAGALIVIAAPERFHEGDNEILNEDGSPVLLMKAGKRIPKTLPVIGVHRAFFDRAFYASLSLAKAREYYDELERLVKEYLKEMSAPDAFIEEMFQSASTDIRLMAKDEFESYFPRKARFFEEYLVAKCSPLTAQDRSTLAKLVLKKNALEKEGSTLSDSDQDALDGLIQKFRASLKCREKTLQAHQDEFFAKMK